MSTDSENGPYPKSMRHKRILDVAAENPDASVETLASMVPSATVDVVERVFEQYDDPASADDSTPDSQADLDDGADDSEPTADGQQPGPAETASQDASVPENAPVSNGEYPSPSELSEKQREVLEAVAADPTATQEEIGERLGVTSPTVSNHANSIEGFDWAERASFVANVFEESPATAARGDGGEHVEPAAEKPDGDDSAVRQPDTESADAEEPLADAEVETAFAELTERLDRLEAELPTDGPREETHSNGLPFAEPELLHKVVHACMEAEAISTDEELRIIEQLLGTADGSAPQ